MAERERLRHQAKVDRQFTRMFDSYDGRVERAQQTVTALDTWHQWAGGKNLKPADLIDAADHLADIGSDHRRLATPLIQWIHEHDIAPALTPSPHPTVGRADPRRPEPPGLEIDL